MSASSLVQVVVRRRPHGDDGGAIIEFCFLGVLLLVPLVYLVLAVFAVQSTAYGVAAATREAGRAFVTTPPGAEPATRAFAAANVATADHGVVLEPSQLAITASSEGCLAAGDVVTVRIAVEVPLPFVPDVLAGAVGSTVGVEGEHVEHVDRYRAGTCLP